MGGGVRSLAVVVLLPALSGGQCTGCIPSSPCEGVVCPTPPDCHLQGTCNPTNGVCTVVLSPDGTPCGGGSGKCVAGSCHRHVPCGNVNCSLSSVCRKAVCRGQTCGEENLPDGSLCTDGNPTTVEDHCVAGECRYSDLCKSVRCDRNIPPCRLRGICSVYTGRCAYPHALNGSACGIGGRCEAGECSGGSAPAAPPVAGTVRKAKVVMKVDCGAQCTMAATGCVPKQSTTGPCSSTTGIPDTLATALGVDRGSLGSLQFAESGTVEVVVSAETALENADWITHMQQKADSDMTKVTGGLRQHGVTSVNILAIAGDPPVEPPSEDSDSSLNPILIVVGVIVFLVIFVIVMAILVCRRESKAAFEDEGSVCDHSAAAFSTSESRPPGGTVMKNPLLEARRPDLSLLDPDEFALSADDEPPAELLAKSPGANVEATPPGRPPRRKVVRGARRRGLGRSGVFLDDGDNDALGMSDGFNMSSSALAGSRLSSPWIGGTPIPQVPPLGVRRTSSGQGPVRSLQSSFTMGRSRRSQNSVPLQKTDFNLKELFPDDNGPDSVAAAASPRLGRSRRRSNSHESSD